MEWRNSERRWRRTNRRSRSHHATFVCMHHLPLFLLSFVCRCSFVRFVFVCVPVVRFDSVRLAHLLCCCCCCGRMASGVWLCDVRWRGRWRHPCPCGRIERRAETWSLTRTGRKDIHVESSWIEPTRPEEEKSEWRKGDDEKQSRTRRRRCRRRMLFHLSPVSVRCVMCVCSSSGDVPQKRNSPSPSPAVDRWAHRAVKKQPTPK